MIEIRFLDDAFAALRAHLVRGRAADEEAALLLAAPCQVRDLTALLVREIIPVPDSGLLQKGGAGLTIDPEFLAPVIKRARQDSLSVLMCHSHPFSDRTVSFSAIDDAGEAALFPKIQGRVPGRVHGTIVFGQRSLDARAWLPESNRRVIVDRVRRVGSKLTFEFPSSGREGLLVAPEETERYNRQVLAFTAEGQKAIARLRVGIVGLGGIGSHVFQMLLHLGVRQFVLVDPDVVEKSNLSRLIGAVPSDASERTPKVEVMKRSASLAFPDAAIEAIRGNVYHLSAAAPLKAADIIFGCTDTMISRMVLTRFPPQYYVPLIDLGINIQVTDGKLTRIGGRVMVLRPQDPCLDCLGYIDHRTLESELASEGVVGPTPYVTGANAPEPAVVSYNAVVAGLGVNELIRLATEGFPSSETRSFQVFDGIVGVVRQVALEPDRDCGVCRELRGSGDLVPLPCIGDR